VSSKNKRRLLQLLGFVTGVLFGLWRPTQIQTMLPILGITVGIGYFFLSRNTIESKKELSDIKCFIPIQMIMYFLIGGVIGSTIILYTQLY